MSRFNCFVGLAIVILAAGCAATPEVATQNASEAPLVGTAPDAVAELGVNEPPQAGEPIVVDIADLTAGAPSRICRQMLKPLTNVIRTYCLTPADWKRYEEQEAIQAQQILRMMQGSAFR